MNIQFKRPLYCEQLTSGGGARMTQKGRWTKPLARKGAAIGGGGGGEETDSVFMLRTGQSASSFNGFSFWLAQVAT